MSIMLLKGLLLIFFNMKIKQKVLYFTELYCICILNQRQIQGCCNIQDGAICDNS